jgi:soluble lytic murein transglycosylase-like protein
VCALLVAGVAAVRAQPCAGPLPGPGAAPAAGTQDKFWMIAQACASLGQPARAQRAEQLERYSVVISLDDAPLPSAAAPTALPPAPPLPATKLDAAGRRVLEVAPTLVAAARDNDLDPLLLHAIAHIESRHNAKAKSPAGARGVMQVMPATAQRFGVANPEQTLFDPDTNVNASAALLRTLKARYGDDLRLVLAAYNAGEGAVAKYGRDVPPYPETQAYVRDVLAVYRKLRSTFSVSASGELVARAGAFE